MLGSRNLDRNLAIQSTSLHICSGYDLTCHAASITADCHIVTHLLSLSLSSNPALN